jgi:3-hydroxyisobutyrate dehydrogenase-like beta-hydroxyacid dehydrogenase
MSNTDNLTEALIQFRNERDWEQFHNPKDLAIALEVARDAGVPAPFSALCRELWAAAAVSLGPGEDHTAVAKFSEHMAGTALGGGNA